MPDPVAPVARAPSSEGSPAPHDGSTGQLLAQFSQQTTELVRSELRLAPVEMTEKAKYAGLGAGLFGGAGVVALYGVGALVATLVLGLALVLPAWLAAPVRAVEGLKTDVETIKGGSSR